MKNLIKAQEKLEKEFKSLGKASKALAKVLKRLIKAPEKLERAYKSARKATNTLGKVLKNLMKAEEKLENERKRAEHGGDDQKRGTIKKIVFSEALWRDGPALSNPFPKPWKAFAQPGGYFINRPPFGEGGLIF